MQHFGHAVAKTCSVIWHSGCFLADFKLLHRMCISITLSNSNWLCQPHAIFLGTENSKACLTVSVCRFLSQLAEREKKHLLLEIMICLKTPSSFCVEVSPTAGDYLSVSIIKSPYHQGQRCFFTRYHGSWQHLQPWYHRIYLISHIPCILQMGIFIVFMSIWIRRYSTKWEFIDKTTFRALKHLVIFNI